MKKLTPLLIFIIILNSCSSSKNYVATKNKDNALEKAVQKLNKDATNVTAIKAIPILYKEIEQTHLAKIKSYSFYKDSSHWNNMISEYAALQNAYNVIINSPGALKIVTPNNYNVDLQKIKEIAAEHFYELAQSKLEKPGRDNAKGAYDYFKIADNYIPANKDTKSKINIAYGRAVINVVIDSLDDNNLFSKSIWGKAGYNFSNNFFQEKLIADLQNILLKSHYPTSFYTKADAVKNNIRVDLIVNLKLTEISDPRRHSLSSSSRINTQTFSDAGPYSTDSSFGSPPRRSIYNDDYAIETSTDYSMSLKALLEVHIKDIATGKDIISKPFKAIYEQHQNEIGYVGDSRAGIGKDFGLSLNNIDYGTPRMQNILENLYSKIYPHIKDNIIVALN